jgi:hypothetical protein
VRLWPRASTDTRIRKRTVRTVSLFNHWPDCGIGPKTSSWLPNGASSAIFVTDFPDPKDLATFLKKLNQDDSLYEAFLEHKTAQKISNKRLKDTILGRAWGVGDDNVISKGSFIAHFECFLCDQLHVRNFPSQPNTLSTEIGMISLRSGPAPLRFMP